MLLKVKDVSSFKFRSLLGLAFDKRTNLIDFGAVMRALPNTPPDVAQQVYSDHGRKDEHQRVYGDVDLRSLTWCSEEICGNELILASALPAFQHWMDSVAVRASAVCENNWSGVDSRSDVVAHWEKHQTWKRAPVFIEGGVLGRSNALHLVEGHTRVGLLRGLIKSSLVAPSTTHSVWVGRVTK